MRKNILIICTSLLINLNVSAQSLVSHNLTEKYQWESVPIRGGGFVPGIIMHPKAKDVRYCRTDMGGAYKWNEADKSWHQLLDWLPESETNLQGVESIAIDPNNPQHVMLACGTSSRSNGAILVSDDGCNTMRRTDVPFGMGGNEDGRGNGERLMFSPDNSSIAYMGTRHSGLWRTTDNGKNWSRIESMPAKSIITLAFDKGIIYVAASDQLYCSKDEGLTWQSVQGQPLGLLITHMVKSSDAQLFITYADAPGPSRMNNGALFSYNIKSGKWSDITPFKPKGAEKLGFGYAAVSVDEQNPKHIIASTHALWGKHGFGDEELFRTTDGGKHWIPIFLHGYEYDCTLAPYTEMAPLHWMFDVEIDPFNPEHAMITSGFGGWETFNLSDCEKDGGIIRWSLISNGIEETVPLEIYCPPSGTKVMVGIGDYGSFTYDDITKVPDGSNDYPHFANTDGITGAWLKPEMCVRVGEVFHGRKDQLAISWSEDGGHKWQMCQSVPQEGALHGHIAVSAMGTSWIWTPNNKSAYYTTDKGITWTECQGLPRNIRTVADKQNDQKFYALDIVGRHLYTSTDGGKTFACDTLLLDGGQGQRFGRQMQQSYRGDHRGGQDRVYPVPDHEGDLWIAAYDGLYHIAASNNSQSSGTIRPEQFSQVRTINAFGFGKGITNDYPSLYLIGIVNGEYGFFRSDDSAKTWIRINDDDHQYGHVLHIAGDMQEYGRVYIGTHGRGLITGSPHF